MDWDNIVVIILWVWVIRYITGAAYGIYSLRKNSDISNWNSEAWYVCGIPFWIVYGIVRLIQKMKRAIESKHELG